MLALTREVANLGHSVEVVTALPNHLRGRIFDEYRGKFYVRETIQEATVHRTWVYATNDRRVAKRLLNYGSFVATSLIGLSRADSADFLFVQSPPLFLSLPAGLFSRLRHMPIILDVADLWPKSVRMLGVMRPGFALTSAERLERWAYARAQFINAATQGIYDQLSARPGLGGKVLFLPNGVDTSLFRPREPDSALLKHLGLKGKNIVIYAGTHGLAYRLDLLARVAADLADSNTVFLLIGDGHGKQPLANLVKELRLTNMILVDPQPEQELQRYYSLAHACVIPLAKNELFKETRPAKIFSSMASGVPIIYSGDGEGARLVEEAGAGIVTPPEDASALAVAITKMISHESARRAMGAAARRYVISHFDWKTIISRWLAELLNRDSSTRPSHEQSL
jgi:colanic acid biosynthesis glycosyl transferase WcaI